MLGIVGLIIGGIWVAASALQQNRIVGQTVSGLMVIDANLTRIFDGRTASTVMLTGQSLAMAVQGADGFAAAASSAATPIPNTAALIQYSAPGAARVTIVAAGAWIPVALCIKIVSQLTAAAGSRLTYVWLTGAPNAYLTAFPVIPTAAQCTNATSIDIHFK